jgi:hypothetical protein
MEEIEQPSQDSYLDKKKKYLKRVKTLRKRVAQNMAGLNVVVHRLDERHPNQLFEPENTTYVMLNRPELEEDMPFDLTGQFHIVTKEIIEHDNEGNEGWLVNHFGLLQNEVALLKHYGRRIDLETRKTIKPNRFPAGPPFYFTHSDGLELKFRTKLLGTIEFPEEDDFVFNNSGQDMLRAIDYADGILDIVSDDTRFYPEV